MSKRWGQGNEVDRDQPHFFHRDYWTLVHIRRGLLEFLRDYGPALKGKRAIDFGCGHSPYRAHFHRAGIELIPADVDPADSSVLPIGSDGRVPLLDASVDAVISTQVLEHVPDPRKYLEEAHRLLRPGGLLYVSTHGSFVLHRHPADYRRWTIDGLRYELEQAGFVVHDVRARLGMLAAASHLRSIALGALTRRVRWLGWARPIIYGLFNLRMGIEERLTPAGAREAHPELLTAVARATGERG